MNTKLFAFLILAICTTLVSSGCGTVANLAGANERAIVIAERAQIRSSGAIVSADLLEVRRGTTLEVLGEDFYENDNAKEKWYNVRASDEAKTEGWIESRDVLTYKKLEEAKRLYEMDKEIPTQATGQLRAATNLRLSPDRTTDDNIMQKMLGGTNFEIVGWQRIRKPPSTEEEDEKDDQTKAKAKANAQNRPRRKREKPQEDVVRLDDIYETWYKVRLDPSISPAPAGWLYGKQVELTVPPDIIFYRTGREFVAWSKIDGDVEGNVTKYAQGTKNGGELGKEAKPASWVVLERSSRIEEPNGEEPDFDHVRVMGYEKSDQNHYKVYLSGKVKGFLPLRVAGSGDSRTVTVRIKGDDGQLRDIILSTFKDSRGYVKVNAPPEMPKEDKNDR